MLIWNICISLWPVRTMSTITTTTINILQWGMKEKGMGAIGHVFPTNDHKDWAHQGNSLHAVPLSHFEVVPTYVQPWSAWSMETSTQAFLRPFMTIERNGSHGACIMVPSMGMYVAYPLRDHFLNMSKDLETTKPRLNVPYLTLIWCICITLTNKIHWLCLYYCTIQYYISDIP